MNMMSIRMQGTKENRDVAFLIVNVVFSLYSPRFLPGSGQCVVTVGRGWRQKGLCWVTFWAACGPGTGFCL